MTRIGHRLWLRPWFGLVLLALGGCEKTLVVRHYPEFYNERIKTVAVMPFYNETWRSRAGEIFASRLAALLKANGTYDVLGPRELGTEGLLKPATPPATRPVIEQLGKSGKVQALIYGTVTTCSASGHSYLVADDEGPDWYYPDGGRFHRYRYDYPQYHYEFVTQANVEVTATMIKVSDGSVLCSTPTPVQATVTLNSYSPPSRDVLTDAVDKAAGQLVGLIAIVPVKVKVNPAKDLRTATGRRSGQWLYSDVFGLEDEAIHVVLHLPPAADRNPFRLTISPQGDTGEVLAAEDFQWSSKDNVRGFAFSLTEIVAGAGPGPYQVNFYAGGKLVMRHSFAVR